MIRKTITELLETGSGIQLDIGCGDNKQLGYYGMDIRDIPTADIVHDCEEYPWPLPDESVLRALAIHIVEHINPHRFGFIKWMDEVWRILRPDGQLVIVTPHGYSMGYLQDPTHCNPCNETTWLYFDPLLPVDTPGVLYRGYRPKPWKVEKITFSPEANIEVLMRKRREDPLYYGETNPQYL